MFQPDPDGDTLTYSVVEGATYLSVCNKMATIPIPRVPTTLAKIKLQKSDGTATVDFTLSIAVQDVKEPTPFNEVGPRLRFQSRKSAENKRSQA